MAPARCLRLLEYTLSEIARNRNVNQPLTVHSPDPYSSPLGYRHDLSGRGRVGRHIPGGTSDLPLDLVAGLLGER